MTDVLPEAPPGTEAPLPLAGYTVAVTAARRREELGALLARRGARVVYAPAIRIVPLADDADLVAATREVLAQPVDLVVATTGVGFRGWLEAAGRSHGQLGLYGPAAGQLLETVGGGALADLPLHHTATVTLTGASVLLARWAPEPRGL